MRPFVLAIKTRYQINNINEQNNYRVLARKYRPNDFSQLIGQDTLVKTFNNALVKGRQVRVSLTGIRGVGKTTTARIIATLNCIGDGSKKDPSFEICNNCSPCQSINNGNFLDVIEVDVPVEQE